MKKVSKKEAIQLMSDIDFKVYEQELSNVMNWSIENQKPFTEDFYIEDDGSIILYFVSDGLNLYPRFIFEGKKVGRPTIGVTKKVSITLPSELWDKISEYQIDLAASRSETFRTILEEFFADIERSFDDV